MNIIYVRGANQLNPSPPPPPPKKNDEMLKLHTLFKDATKHAQHILIVHCC